MKILYVITSADGGGAQKYVLTLAKHFGGEIACGNEKADLFNQAQAQGIKTYKLKYLKRSIHPLFDVLAVFEMAKLIKNVRPDIVHLNSSKAGILGSLAGKLAGVKVVFTAHGFHFNESGPLVVKKLSALAEKIASYFRDYIIAATDADRNSAIAKKVISPNKIQTIHNGIAQVNFLEKGEARAQLNLASDKIQFGCLGGLYKTKGFDVLIEAISLLNDDLKNKMHLTIIGDGPEKDNLKLKIENLKITNLVSMPGKLSEANRILKAFDLFIMPSRKEGLPFVLLEAMQAGLPIVATKVGGIPEALNNGGLIVSPENPKLLAQAIEQMLADENLRQQFAKKAFELSASFTETKMLQETREVYTKLLS